MTDEHRCSLIDLCKVNNSSSFERNNLKHEMNSVSYNSFPKGEHFVLLYVYGALYRCDPRGTCMCYDIRQTLSYLF